MRLQLTASCSLQFKLHPFLGLSPFKNTVHADVSSQIIISSLVKSVLAAPMLGPRHYQRLTSWWSQKSRVQSVDDRNAQPRPFTRAMSRDSHEEDLTTSVKTVTMVPGVIETLFICLLFQCGFLHRLFAATYVYHLRQIFPLIHFNVSIQSEQLQILHVLVFQWHTLWFEAWRHKSLAKNRKERGRNTRI